MLEYDAIFDESYATAIGEMYNGTTSVPFTKVTPIYSHLLSKKDTTWKIDVKSLSVHSLQGLLVLFVEYYNPSIKKILVTINGMSHQLLAAGLQARDIFQELGKYFYKEHSDVTWEEFLTTRFGLWIDTRSSIDNTLHGIGRAVEKSGILLEIQRVSGTSNDVLKCYVLSHEDAVTHLSVTNPSGILTIEK